MKRIAIIGGGFSGTMALYHLVTDPDLPPVEITFFDGAGRHARGVAYSTPMDEHLLNVPAAGMSALPGEPDHFLNWLDRGERCVFYPRRLYGRYIQEFYDTAIKTAQDMGHKISIESRFVREITPDAGRNGLRVDGAGYDAVILATGASQPQWPGKAAMPDDARFIPNPYVADFPDRLVELKTKGHVVILGTGLSAVDALMSLHRAGYAGRITCISRRGRWPVRHGMKKPWDWRNIIDSLRPHSNNLWRSMPQWLRSACLNHIGTWNVLRHRMPRQCHDNLKSMMKSKHMKVVRGAVRDVTANGEGVSITTDHQTIQADVVINCLGFIGVGVLKNPLYAGLRDAGLLRIQNGLPNPDGYRLADDYPLFIMGPPLFGYLLETTAVPELKVQAHGIAKDVSAHIRMG